MKQFGQLTTYFFILALFFTISSCGGTAESTENLGNENTDNTEKLEKAKTILHSLPAPVDIASILFEEPGAEFNKEILNPIENSKKYNGNKDLALNLGIYTADLSYAGFFKQNQVTLNYIKTTKEIANNLGISNSFDNKHLELINNNQVDKAAMQKIISESFMNTDAYLQQNDRPEVLTLILVGGWIEAQYLATKLTNGSTTEKPELVQRIVDQSLTLELMFALFDDFEKSENIMALKPSFSKLKNSYKKMNGGLTPDNYKEFCTLIEEIRTEYVI